MTRLVSESFDRWPNAASMTAGGAWNAVSAFTVVVPANTQFARGQAAQNFAGNVTFKNAGNESTVFGTVRFRWNSATPATNAQSIILRDGATDQVTLQLLGNGNIVIRSGGAAGTILHTATSAFLINTWNSFQFRVVVHNTTGEFQVRLNGSTANLINLTGVNTRGGTANNHVTALAISSGSTSQWIDDIFLCNGDGIAPTGWLGDVRCSQQLPLGVSSSTLTAVGPTRTLGGTNNISTSARSANVVYLKPMTMGARPLVVDKGTIGFNAGVTGNVKMGIWADAAGVPGALIATSSVVTNPSTGLNDFAFASAPELAPNTAYWIGYHSDVGFTVHIASGSSTLTQQNLAYSSGLPDPPVPTSSASAFNDRLYLTFSNTVASEIADGVHDDDTSYAFGSAGGAAEVTMAPLGAVPVSIVGIEVYARYRKTDAGSITLTVNLDNTASSGGSGAVLTDSAMNTTYAYGGQFRTTQMDGTSPLTLAAINDAVYEIAVS
jgi:hypothetical protein